MTLNTSKNFGGGLRTLGWLWLGFSLLYLLTTPGHLYTVDSQMSYHTTKALALHGSLVIPPSIITVEDAEGRPTGRHGVLQSALCIPLYYVGAGLDRLFPNPDLLKEKWTVTLVMTLNQWLGALTVVLFMQVLRGLGVDYSPALACAMVLAFATPWWTYSRDLFRQVLAGLLLMWSLLATIRYSQTAQRRYLISAALAMGLSFANRITIAVTWPGLLFLLVASNRHYNPRKIVRILLVTLGVMMLGVALQIGVNLWRFGDWWGYAYENRVFSLSFLRESLPEFLVSPGRGLLLFAPVLVLLPHAIVSGWKHQRSWTIGLLAVFLAKLALFSVYYDFRGGVNPGPRYLIPVIPVVMLLIGMLAGKEWPHRSFRWSLLVFGALGVVVNGFNSLIYYQRTLTFWDQVLRWWGFPDYDRWPAWDARSDLADVLIGQWFWEGRYLLLAGYLTVLIGGAVFAFKKARRIATGLSADQACLTGTSPND